MAGTEKITGTGATSGVVGDIAKDAARSAQVGAELQVAHAKATPTNPDELAALEQLSKTSGVAAPEIIDSVELQLPNGVRIEMAQPKVATAFIMSRILASDEGGGNIAIAYIKSLLYISRFNGEKVPPLMNMVDVQALANKLGDDGLDIVLTAYTHYWPGVTPANLPVVKKNLRG